MKTPLPTEMLDDGKFGGDDVLHFYVVLRFCLDRTETFQIVEDWSSGEHYIVGLEDADGCDIEVDSASLEVLDSIAFRVGRELRQSLSEAALQCDQKPGDGTYWSFPVSALVERWPELVERWNAFDRASLES